MDTSSCLAFAPKDKHGTGNQATKEESPLSLKTFVSFVSQPEYPGLF